MSAAIIDSQVSMGAILEELAFTRARLAASPLTTGMLPAFDEAMAEWAIVNGEELEHCIAEVHAAARVAAADDDLALFADDLAKALLTLPPQLALPSGNPLPALTNRPLLAADLDALEGWVTPLRASPHTALVERGARLASLVARSRAARSGLSAAEAATRRFRADGQRPAFVDRVNALRADTWVALSRLQGADGRAALPGEIVAGCFQRPGRGHDARRSLAELEAEVDARRAELAKLSAQLERARAATASEAAAEAKLEANGAAMAAAKKVAADAAARMAEFEAGLRAG